MLDRKNVEGIIDIALREDIGSGDITSEWTVSADAVAEAELIAKEEGIIAGLDVADLVFQRVNKRIKLMRRIEDGKRASIGDVIAEVRGPARDILTAERTALNFLRRMSGIATMTWRYVQAVDGTGAKITDTRKTTPGLRTLEKYAVRVGGGVNHRFGLYDMVLIKDNHIEAAGGITQAVDKVKEQLSRRGRVKVEVEARNLKEVEEALSVDVDRIMFDNMSCEEMREAVRVIHGSTHKAHGRPEIEASGRITLENVREVAETGVDFISVGALTHSPKALDISLSFR